MTFVSTQRKWAMIATRQMTIASSTSAICGSKARMPSKKETREEDQRWERQPISIVFGQTMTSFWKRIISVKIRFSRQQCSGGASGWDVCCLRRFLIICFLRILTFLRRRMPWVYWDFRHTKQKLTSALRMLAYGSSADQLDDLTRMSETTTLNNLHHFCNAIINR